MKKFIEKFIWNYKYFLLFIFFLGFTEAILGVYISKQVENIVNKDQLELISSFGIILLGFVVYRLLYQSIFFIKEIIDFIILPRATAYIIKHLYLKITSYSLYWFNKNFSASIAKKINDFNFGLKISIDLCYSVINQIFYLFFSFIALFIINKYSGFLLLFLILIYSGIFFIFFKKYIVLRKISENSLQSHIGVINDSISKIYLIKILTKINIEFNRYVFPSLRKAYNSESQALKYKSLILGLYNFIVLTLIACLQVGFAIFLLSKNIINLGEFAFIFSLVIICNDKIKDFFNHIMYDINNMLSYIKSTEELFVNLNPVIDYFDNQISNAYGEIIIKNVSFTYPEDNRKTLKNINLHIKAGSKIGLVGFSGSGKSTLINCILRCFEVDDGEIIIDNQNIKDVTQESLREQISIIPQDYSLMHRSIADNLRLAKDGATLEEMQEVCKIAGIHQAIIEMEHGYETMLGENGAGLSGGQKQRLSIARALLKKASILILDEATSALDANTEKIIQDSLWKIFAENKMTVIFITHKMSLLKNMDNIVVLAQGKIIQQGTHEQLIKEKNGLYVKLS